VDFEADTVAFELNEQSQGVAFSGLNLKAGNFPRAAVTLEP